MEWCGEFMCLHCFAKRPEDPFLAQERRLALKKAKRMERKAARRGK